MQCVIKIFSKVLVNRLKSHFGNIITENQTAFIPSIVILDNIIVAHEIFHSLKSRKSQSTSYMAVKTYITKAYDRLEWSFLNETMKHMGFDDRWIHLVMTCVTTVNFSILINSSPEGHKGQKGVSNRDTFCRLIYSYYVRKSYLT